MRTFISHFTPSKYFYNFLIILVTHIFQSNKKPGKPLIVRAFPAFPGQSPTVPTISLFLTFILLGYNCIRPSHKMHSRGNTTSDMHTKAEIRSGSGSWINIPVLLPFSKSFYPFVFLLFSPSFFFLPLLLYFIYHLYHFLQLIHISIHLFSKTNTAIVHYVRFYLSFLYLFVLYVYNILYSFCTVKQCYT